MKRKLYAGGTLIFIFGIIAAGLIFFFDQKTEVNASSKVFVEQPYIVHFSEPIHANSINENSVYITTVDGEEIEAFITLKQNNQSIQIEGLQVGKYIFHIKEKAFKNKGIKNSKREIEFEVIEKIEGISSIQQLKDYFLTIMENPVFETVIESTEESSVGLSSTRDSAGLSSFSTTNNQVDGIEEGDIVVTDGHYIYSIVDNEIIITDVTDPANLKVADRISFDAQNYPTEMIIHEQMLIVILEANVEKEKGHNVSMTKAQFYDISNGTKGKFIREVGQEGYINGVRKYDDMLYIVTNTIPDYYWIMEEGKEENLLPSIYDSSLSETLQPLSLDKMTILPGASQPNYTMISALDLSNFETSNLETKGYLGGSTTLYMSNQSIYLTVMKHSPTAFRTGEIIENNDDKELSDEMRILPIDSEMKTDIYKYAINGTKIEFVASTEIKGTLLNQFSMDEYKGYFRLAITEGKFSGTTQLKNHLYIYDENLQKVGEITNLAKGEQIYAARFMDEKAYVVTFKEVDPLFVIDLKNPKQPKILGELKVPGFSNYLHPLDKNHLIGIGYHTETQRDNNPNQPIITTTGIKLSLFNVKDVSKPKEQDSVVIGGPGTFSEVAYNHKALFRNGEYNYYGFPINIYEEKGLNEIQYKGTGALIYEITAENGIELRGNLIEPAKSGEMNEDWEKVITRILYIGDTMFTVSRSEVKSYHLKTFEVIGTVTLR